MTKKEFLQKLDSRPYFFMCNEARFYIEKAKQTPETLWNRCSTGSWMLYLISECYFPVSATLEDTTQSMAMSVFRDDIIFYSPKWDDLAQYNMDDPIFTDETRKTFRKAQKPLADLVRKYYPWSKVEKFLSK